MAVGHHGDGRITEEMVATLMARLGKGKPGVPWTEEATEDTIRHFALGAGDDNPLYLDLAYAQKSRHGTLIAPPMFPYVTISAGSAAGGMGFPGIFALHAWDHWTFDRPVRLGDRLHSLITLVGLEEKPSRWGGRAFHQTVESRFFDAENKVVCNYQRMSVRAERSKTRENRKYEPVETYKYSQAELDEIANGYDTEERRGATPRYWEDVQVGDSLGHVVKGPLTVSDMFCWWMGVGAPFLNAFRIRHMRLRKHPGLAIIDPDTNIRHVPEIAHFDEKYALRSGVGAAYDIGRQRTAWALHMLTNWVGDDGWVKEIRVRIERPNYVGDTTWVRGKVVEKYVENGEHLAKAEFTETNQRGQQHAQGYAFLQLPSKG